ncbi:MAG TPA: class I SAM-dependent methyltransferase [Gaiellaceae bacterium]|nr:class I SAM-dependent methyltransferase [Gaiellaceae bacterium]
MSRAQDTEAVKDYFSREAERFDAIYDGSNRSPLQAAVDRLWRTRTLNKRNALIASLVDEGASCFEIGCGSGRTAVAIAAARRARVHGIDVAAPMIGLAERHAQAAGVEQLCRFEAADFDGLQPQERYDTFVAVGVLDYFADPLPMLRRAATEFAPGGSIVLSWPAAGLLLNPARRAWLATKGVPVSFYRSGEIERIAGELGGRVVRTIRNGIGPLVGDGLTRIDLR